MKEFKGALLVWGRKKGKYVWNQGLVMMQCFFFAWRLNSGVWKLQIMQQKKRRQFLQECLKPFKVWSFLHPAGKNILSWPVGCSSVLRQTLYPGCVLLLQLGQEHTLEHCAHTHTFRVPCCTPRCCKPKSAKRNREWGCLRRMNPTRLSGSWIYWRNRAC